MSDDLMEPTDGGMRGLHAPCKNAFWLRLSDTQSTQPLQRHVCSAVQIRVTSRSVPRPLRFLFQKLSFPEHVREVVKLQRDLRVLGTSVLTETLTYPPPNVRIHCAHPRCNGPVPCFDVFFKPSAAEFIGDDASIEPVRVWGRRTMQKTPTRNKNNANRHKARYSI